ncbi:MAG: Crp/Fnr family transcriptional regulator [Methyloversatilis sp.]|jgi:CRP-like cAMP-binding protein|nr:Crp/Fnr family transcriptional regulator [Methyloversatilis sp.]
MGTSSFDVARYIASLPLFEEMSPAELGRIAQGSRIRRHGRGDILFRVGEPCEEFHVTVTGRIKLFATSPDGQEKVIELLGPGCTFAEALMFSGQPYIVGAEALTDTLLLSIGKAAVVGEIERDPKFALRLLAGISRRLHSLVYDVQCYTLHNGLRRVVDYLLRDSGEPDIQPLRGRGCSRPCAHAGKAEAVRVSLPVSKATIASRLSLTPEYFSRMLHELEDAGMICVDKRDIFIPDPQRLADYPEG